MTNAIIFAEIFFLKTSFNIISFYILLGISDHWSVLRLYIFKRKTTLFDCIVFAIRKVP